MITNCAGERVWDGPSGVGELAVLTSVEAIRPRAASASRSQHAPTPPPPAPPRQFPHEQLEDVPVRVEPRILREEVLSRNAGHALDEGADGAAPRDARH